MPSSLSYHTVVYRTGILVPAGGVIRHLKENKNRQFDGIHTVQPGSHNLTRMDTSEGISLLWTRIPSASRGVKILSRR